MINACEASCTKQSILRDGHGRARSARESHSALRRSINTVSRRRGILKDEEVRFADDVIRGTGGEALAGALGRSRHQSVDSGDQGVAINRLGDEFDKLIEDCLGCRRREITGDEDDRQTWRFFANVRDDAEAGCVRESQVGENKIEAMAIEQAQRLGAVFALDRFVADAPENAREELSCVGIVFDD